MKEKYIQTEQCAFIELEGYLGSNQTFPVGSPTQPTLRTLEEFPRNPSAPWG